MLRILIMEDDVDAGLELADHLRDAGHEVQMETSGSAALKAFEAERFDMIIADLLVYGASGLVPDGGVSLIAKVRAMERSVPGTSPVPIVAISAAVKQSGLPHVLESARSVGATITMQKPIVMKKLLDFAAKVATQKVHSS